MNILSCFDGMSCGRIALERAGIKVDKYYVSEIDKYAIKIAQKNYPNNIQLGDINDWESWNLKNIDMIIGGSPCQGFSNSGRGLNFDDPRSKLFFTFLDILNAYNPKYFLLENVTMKKDWKDTISNYIKAEPIEIDSSLVSAQSRKRLYWTNVPNVVQPKNKNALLKDVIESGQVDREKSYCIDTCYYKGYSLKQYIKRKRRQLVQMPSEITVHGNIAIDEPYYRKLTPLECERLQTVPENYTESVSNTQRYKMLGNGWTVDVIAHIFSFLPDEYKIKP